MWEAGAGVVAVAGGMAWAARGRSAAVFAPSVWHGRRDSQDIALTFDDGPSESTPELLALLDQFQAKATFFVCGANAERLPSMVPMIAAAGHEVGNHTWNHRRLDFCPTQVMREEIGRTQALVQQQAGASPQHFRAPFGVRWFGLGGVQREFGLMGVMWTVIGLDWKLPAPAIASRILKQSAGGSILCMHDGRGLQTRPDVSATLAATREFMPRLRDAGFQFRTVSAILES